MTLPASFPLSMSQIATELGLSLPLSINHPWVLLLAGKTALPVSFSEFLGKSGHYTGSSQIQQAGTFEYFVTFTGAAFFNSSIIEISETPAGGITVFTSQGSHAVQNPLKILVKDNTTGQSAILTQVPSTGNGLIGLQWQLNPGSVGIFGNVGQTHNFTILPSN